MTKYLYSGGNNEPQIIDLRDSRYNINILFGIIIAGFMTLLYDYGWAEVVGYSLITFSTFMILFISMSFANRKKMTKTPLEFTLYTIKKGFPIIIILFLLTWIISLNVTYHDVISERLVPIDYFSYARHAAWLFILLMYLLRVFCFKSIDPENSQDKVSRYSTIIITFVSTVVFWVLSIMQIILTYYITDG